MALKKIGGLLLIFIGLILMVRGHYLNWKWPINNNVQPVSDNISSEPVKFEGFSDTAAKMGDVGIPTRIIIPDLVLDVPIKKARIVQGYWELFSDVASWGEGSGLSGKPGNTVIFAHVRKGLFLPLENVKQEMKVYVMTQTDWYEYQIKEIKVVNPNQTEVVSPTPDETLTLYTCSGFDDSKRLVVVAKSVD